ncbi:MAG: hypothetical protein WCW17_03590 [Patescibacteria group bacterium]|jgi:hypothetical protein
MEKNILVSKALSVINFTVAVILIVVWVILSAMVIFSIEGAFGNKILAVLGLFLTMFIPASLFIVNGIMLKPSNNSTVLYKKTDK